MHTLVLIAGCLFAAAVRGSEPRVITSFLPVYCCVANVAGDLAHVENLLSSRAEPHDYAFTPGDARKLRNAHLIFVNGLGLETWLPRFLRSSPESSRKVVSLSDAIDHSLLIHGGHEHAHGRHAHEAGDHDDNPHIWLDPLLAAQCVTNIAAAFQRIDAANATHYATNAQRYIARLNQLDADIRRALDSVTNRAIVTYHDAFPYFARRYGLEIVGVVEEVPDVNPTPKYLAKLGRTMRQHSVRSIFVPPGGATRLARRIAADLRVDLVELDTIESGELAPDSYEKAMRVNAEALRRALLR